VFHDLKLMEREGSGIDLLFERLLASGRAAPTVTEGTDSVHVTVPRRVVQPGVIRLLADADQRYQLTQRERIVFALLAQTEGLSAVELAERLELDDPAALRPWLGRLLEWGLVEQTGRTKATRYFVPPALLREAGLDKLTTLTRVQPHRLRALILEDLERFPDSGRGDIHRRIGPEILLCFLSSLNVPSWFFSNPVTRPCSGRMRGRSWTGSRIFVHLVNFSHEFDSKPVEGSLLPETSGERSPKASQNGRFCPGGSNAEPFKGLKSLAIDVTVASDVASPRRRAMRSFATSRHVASRCGPRS
jgi:DNA-binding MarR family transcriptional regulator